MYKGTTTSFSPPGHRISDAVQDAFGLLGRLGTLVAHVQLASYQQPLGFPATLPHAYITVRGCYD